MDELNANTKNELGDIIERIESLTVEKTQANEKIKAEYEAAAGAGFDKKAIQQIIKERAADQEKSIKHRRIVELYRKALSGLAGTPLGDWARSWRAQDALHEARSKEPTALDEFMSKRKEPKDEGDRPSP